MGDTEDKVDGEPLMHKFCNIFRPCGVPNGLDVWLSFPNSSLTASSSGKGRLPFGVVVVLVDGDPWLLPSLLGVDGNANCGNTGAINPQEATGGDTSGEKSSVVVPQEHEYSESSSVSFTGLNFNRRRSISCNFCFLVGDEGHLSLRNDVNDGCSGIVLGVSSGYMLLPSAADGCIGPSL